MGGHWGGYMGGVGMKDSFGSGWFVRTVGIDWTYRLLMFVWGVCLVAGILGIAWLGSGCMPYRHSWVQRPGVYVEGYPGWTYQQPVFVPRRPNPTYPRVYRPGIDGPSAYDWSRGRF